MGALKFRAFVLFIIVSTATVFGNVKQMNAIADKAIAALNHNNYYTNGDYEYGILSEGKSHYVTMTLYKGINYALAIGTNDNVKEMELSVYGENMLNLVKKASIKGNGFEIVNITPEKTGTYYVKLFMKNGKKSDCEWISLYGFKKKK